MLNAEWVSKPEIEYVEELTAKDMMQKKCDVMEPHVPIELRAHDPPLQVGHYGPIGAIVSI